MSGDAKNTDPRPPLELPFKYCDTRDMRILDLSKDGIWCVPVLGRTNLTKPRFLSYSEEHTHPECIEISYCQRGMLKVRSQGRIYDFRPGMVFVSRSDEPHTLCGFPKGMLMYWMFFRLPHSGVPLLSLPESEAKWLVDSLVNIPNRLFHGGDAVRVAFQKVFAVYDSMQRGAPQRTMRLRIAVSELLTTILDASADPEFVHSNKRVEAAIAGIRRNPLAPVTIDGLVSSLSMSPSSIISAFKRLTGLPPVSFRNACRIELAKKELEKGSRTIAAIASMLGYSSAQNFATQFRLATKKTPCEWRNFPLPPPSK
jgi:AraC-like DNA-binding protein